MPWNDEQFEIAKKLQQRYQATASDLADRVGPNFDNPEYAKASKRLTVLNGLISDYEAKNRKTDDTGKLTEPPKTRLPAEVIADKTKGFNYHFEPSVAEAQKAFHDDPSLAEKLHLDPDWKTGIAKPETSEPVVDPTTGQVVGATVNPAKTHLDTLSEKDSAYKSYADHLWEQKMNEAKAQGKALQRYRDIHLKNQPADFLVGGIQYNIDRRLVPLQVGLAKSVSMGTAGPVTDFVNGKVADLLGKERPPSTEDVARRNPGLSTAGEFAGYVLPGNLTNMAAEEAAKRLGYEGASALGKVGRSVLTGMGVNSAEGAIRDTAQGLQHGQSIPEATKTAFTNMPSNLLFGAAGGAIGDLAGQGVGALRDWMRESDRMKQLLALERAGGGSNMITGVSATPEIKEFISRSRKGANGEGPEIGSPPALAAEPLVPKMRQHLNARAESDAKATEAQLQEYFNHPYYGTLQVSSKPLVESLVGMIHEGRSIAPVSGAATHMDQDLVGTMRRELVNNKWAEPVFGSPEQAQHAAADVDGVVVDLDTATDLFGKDIVDKQARAGDVAVIVPKKMTAKELTNFERKVYRKLKPREDGSRVESPVYEELNRAAKEVRKGFPLYRDEQGRLVSPPQTPSNGPPPMPKSAPPESEPVSLRPSEYEEVPGSSEAQTVERQSEGEERLGSEDFLPSTQELGSAEIQPATEELISNDFLNSEPAAPAGKPTARLRDLRRRAIPQGPQKGEYPSHNEYLMARAKWRMQQGKATKGDMARFKKAADAIPPTERSPATEVPDTKRSIAPEEETPLSLLAGNKLAMDVPDQPFETSFSMKPPERADESLPVPNAKEWTESNKETGDWFEDIVAPGREPRSDEAKRMGDLMSQSEAFNEAKNQIGNVENRLGEMNQEDKLQSLLNIISQKLGREVTKEDLINAGLLGGGAAAAASADSDENGGGVGAMALGGLGALFGKGKKGQTSNAIRELETTLENGDVVKGFNALRELHHKSATDLDKLRLRTGVDADKATLERIIRFNQGNDVMGDRALDEVAGALGLRDELHRAAGTGAYQDLRERVWGMGGNGFRQGIADIGRHRLDKLFELLSGARRNPFDKSQQGFLEQMGRSGMNITGGRVGARYGNELSDLWDLIFPGKQRSVQKDDSKGQQ
jgi:hypothetical protein